MPSQSPPSLAAAFAENVAPRLAPRFAETLAPADAVALLEGANATIRAAVVNELVDEERRFLDAALLAITRSLSGVEAVEPRVEPRPGLPLPVRRASPPLVAFDVRSGKLEVRPGAPPRNLLLLVTVVAQLVATVGLIGVIAPFGDWAAMGVASLLVLLQALTLAQLFARAETPSLPPVEALVGQRAGPLLLEAYGRALAAVDSALKQFRETRLARGGATGLSAYRDLLALLQSLSGAALHQNADRALRRAEAIAPTLASYGIVVQSDLPADLGASPLFDVQRGPTGDPKVILPAMVQDDTVLLPGRLELPTERRG